MVRDLGASISAVDVVSCKDRDRLYWPLYKAITRGDWMEAENLLDEDKEADTANITRFEETVLHVAVEMGEKSNEFVRKLLLRMPKDAVARKNSYGNTALHRAANIGNKEAVVMLVNANTDLLYIPNHSKDLPVHLAAMNCHKEILVHLLSVSKKDEERNSPFAGKPGASLLGYAIASQFIDVALDLVQNYPGLATLPDNHGNYALIELARSASVFESGSDFSWWQKWIYSIPQVNSIDDKKVMHQQALELAKCMCKALEYLPCSDASHIYEKAIIMAAKSGIHEVVEVIIETFPRALYTLEEGTNRNIFHLAARQRFANVFNLIHRINERKHFLSDRTDKSLNNYMHVCGEEAPPHKLNLVSGPALQMQRELQWFKEMEKFVNPSRRTLANKAGKTPQMLFSENHQKLKSQGEKWMKDTATSCTIVAALIATIVFAVAFIVPGSVDNHTHMPVSLKETPSIIFGISESVSFFTSIASLLTFLAILTSRYAEEDFLHVLPQRLCIGLLTLFMSITFMMIAFSTTIYTTLDDSPRLFFILMATLASLPVATFTFLQSPLLIDVMYSTYGPGIFRKESGRPLF